MKKKLIIMLCSVCLLSFTGCSNEKVINDTSVEMTEEANTVAGKLFASFKEEINKNDNSNVDVSILADNLSKNAVFDEIATATMEVEEGPLNGFKGEITGFKKGTMFSPMIGSMPFIGYIFETDNPDELINSLKENHDLNWNICTSADEMLVEAEGNYVFFVMAPESFDQPE